MGRTRIGARAALAAAVALLALVAAPGHAGSPDASAHDSFQRMSAIAECSLPVAMRHAHRPESRADCLREAIAPTHGGAVAPGAPGPAAAPVCINEVTAVNARCEKWARSFNDRSPDGSTVHDTPAGMVVNRRGDRMFVATTTAVGASAEHMTIAALSTTGNGATLWIAHPPTAQSTSAVAMTLTPDESAVIVVGTIQYLPNLNATPLTFWLTSAYSTSNGRYLWSTLYRLGGSVNAPVSVRTSPRGDRVFVTGVSVYDNYRRAYVEWVTIAYSKSGKQLWLQRYGGAAGGQNAPVGMAVSPAGDSVYVGGASEHPQTTGAYSWDYAVIAYDSRTGRQRWRTVTHSGSNNSPTALSMTPSGDRVFLTGVATFGTPTSPVSGALTVAHATRTGARLWTARYVDTSGLSAAATALSVSPRGDRVYVAALVGQRRTVVAGTLEPTVVSITLFALDARTGAQAWKWSYAPDPNYSSAPIAAAVNPATGSVYVTGIFGPPTLLATYPVSLAVNPAGTTGWIARYDVRDAGSFGAAAGGFPALPVGIVADSSGKSVYTSIKYYPASTGAATTECAQAHSAGLQQDCQAGGQTDLILAFDR
jgi:hypothetical protein